MESAPAPGSGQDIPALIEGLRKLLELPKKGRPPDWDTLVGRHVGLLSVDYSKQADQRLALVELAVLTHAEMAGSKEAKKRLHPMRWSDAPPSVFDNITSPAERKAAIKALSRVRAKWCTNYALTELAHSDAKAVRGDLIAWAARSALGWDECLHAVGVAATALGGSVPDVIKGLVEVAKAETNSSLPLGQSILEAIRDLGRQVTDVLHQKSGGEKKLAVSLASLADLLQVAVATDPRLALNPAIGEALNVLQLRKGGSKALNRKVDQISSRVVSILGLLFAHGGTEARANIASFARTLAASCSAFRVQAEIAIRGESQLRGMLDEQAPNVLASVYPVEEALCSLIPEIDELARLYPQDDTIGQARKRVEALARAVHIERLGMEGELCPFEPFRHLLPDNVGAMPATVRIVKSGLVVTRSDGSQRVVMKAVATAADS